MSEHARAVRAHYQAAVARRLQTAPEAVRQRLQARDVVEAIEGDAVAPPVPATPNARRPRAQPAPPLTPLGQLNQHITARTGLPAGARSELKSAQAFRETWARLRADDEVVQAVQRGPENAGPLNSHMLVLRTLGLLRELSPDYLRRFMAQADTLLWLDQVGSRLKAAPAGKARTQKQKR